LAPPKEDALKKIARLVPSLLILGGCGSPPDHEVAETESPVVETVMQTEPGFYQDLSWDPDGSRLLVSVLDWGSGPGGFSYRIYEIRVDGSGSGPLTNGPRDRWTSWAPSGSRVAFPSVQSENEDICTMSADGSDWTRLTNDPAPDSHPQFSPDGTRIAFVSRRNGEAELYLMSADGTGATRIAEGVWPTWSTDGARILYGGEDGLYEVDLAGTGASRTLPGAVNFARVSPGGSWLGYIVSDSAEVTVHIARLDGSDHSVLLRRPKPDW
jgi:Tol biopolymer transport system component